MNRRDWFPAVAFVAFLIFGLGAIYLALTEEMVKRGQCGTPLRIERCAP